MSWKAVGGAWGECIALKIVWGARGSVVVEAEFFDDLAGEQRPEEGD